MDGGTAAIHEHRLQLIDGNCSHARHPDFQSTSLIIRNRPFCDQKCAFCDQGDSTSPLSELLLCSGGLVEGEGVDWFAVHCARSGL